MSQIKSGIILSYLTILIVNLGGMISTPIIVKTLGNSQYGLYLMISSIVGYIFLVDLGITNTINRFVAKYKALGDNHGETDFLNCILQIVIFLTVIITFIAFIVYVNAANFLSINVEDIALVKLLISGLVLNGVIGLFNGFIDGYLAAYEKFTFSKIVFLLRYVIRLAFLILFFANIGNIKILILLDIILSFLNLALNLYYFFKICPHRFKLQPIDIKLLKEILSYSVWISLFTLISQMQWQTGQIIVGYKLSTEAVAIYGIGILLGTYYGAFSSAISSIFISRTTAHVYQQNDMESLTKYMIKIGRVCAFVLMIILVNFALTGRDFIYLWLNKSFEKAWLIALCFMLVYTLPLVQNIANQVLEAKRLFRFKSLVYFISILFGIVLGYFLIDDYSILGLTFGICVGWVIGIVVLNFYYHKKIGLNMLLFFRKTANIFCLSLVVFFLGKFILNYINLLTNLRDITWSNFIIKTSLVSFVYIILMYVFGCSKNEKLAIKTLWKRYE